MMHYENFAPAESLKNLIKEYWVYENDDPKEDIQKIIPDGFSEIIIHYGDPYTINLGGNWEKQSSMLFSSQISKSFHLKNTGRSAMLGIKLYPSAFYELFQTDVSVLTDQVVDLQKIISASCTGLNLIKQKDISLNERVMIVEGWLQDLLVNLDEQKKIRQCINSIFESNGMIEVEELAKKVNLSTRQLERSFKKVIGLTPKFYCRIIRFNYIFEVMKNHNDSWIRTALQSGYFDQSHFIKNFKEFTGEEPSNYGFDKINLANFFLNK